ncbi:MAG: phytanoyl-CoA dioxygenase family protein [Acidimicrobiia bacterium]
MAVLGSEQLAAYERDGFVCVEEAVDRTLAARCRELLWEEIEELPDDPSTWKRPVVRVVGHLKPEFSQAAQSARLSAAIDEVAGPDAAPTLWLGGTTAVRFPIDGEPGDDGWHIEGSYVGPDGGYWANRRSRDRALFLLVLFSDVGPDDAPTRLRAGSHRLIPEALRPFGDEGVSIFRLPIPDAVHELPQALATGSAGDVYVCHPFLVHAAQRHQGTEPRFLAQPAVPWRAGVAGFPAL